MHTFLEMALSLTRGTGGRIGDGNVWLQPSQAKCLFSYVARLRGLVVSWYVFGVVRKGVFALRRVPIEVM